MAGGITKKTKEYIMHPVDFTSPFRTGVVTTTERREFATPVFLFEYIGNMIYLQTYKMFESMQDGVTPEQRALLNASCQYYQKNNKGVQPKDAWWVDPETGLVNVVGNFILKDKWTEGLLGIKFGKIGGYFNVNGAGLESASELPREIGTHLNAGGNKFRTLEGIGYVKMSISVEDNLLVSLEGLTKELLSSFQPRWKIAMADRNPVRSGFLRDDLEDVLSGKETWTGIYLSIIAGDYAIKKDPDGSIEWILKNKLSPDVLGAEIKNAPAKLAIELAKVPQKHRKALNDILDQIKDLPPGFRDDTELVADLSDIGL
jgi:hypothetical protein